MSHLKPYPDYKPSCVEWLGDVPKHWDVTKIKRGYSVKLGKMLQPNQRSDSDQLLPYMRASNIQPSGIDVSNVKRMWFAPTEQAVLRLSHGDLLVSEGGDVGRSAIWSDEVPEAYFQNSINRIHPLRQNSNVFLNYLLHSIKHTGVIDVICNRISIAHLTAEKLNEIDILFPNTTEQSAIATFLDRETGRIDALVKEKTRFVELLKEKRKALIIRSVTKGLDPNVKMRDSGVDWIGDVPEHWEVKQYRYSTQLFRGKFGHRPRNDPRFYGGKYPFIQTGDIARSEKFIISYKQTLNEKGRSISQKFPTGTLVMAIAANIGNTAILNFEAYCPDSVVGFKPHNGVSLDYLRFSFIASLQALEQTSTQSTQANLNLDRIGSVCAAFPPKKEQLEIINKLERHEERDMNLKNEVQKSIKLLKERRSALITAAVTGKIDVRETK